MECPYCESNQLEVINSRPTVKNSQVWRRRKCINCKGVFTTYESIDLSYLNVVKKSGRHQKFSRAKLYSSIFKPAVEGKDSDRGDMSKLADNITKEIEKTLILKKAKQIKTVELIELILTTLSKRSPEIFLRFLAYREGNSEDKMRMYMKKYF